VDELLRFAGEHNKEEWTTLCEQIPFAYDVTETGIKYRPHGGEPKSISRSNLESFCDEFQELESFSPGDYPASFHKSYSLPLIKRFLESRDQHP
jgi:hypothetical protein